MALWLHDHDAGTWSQIGSDFIRTRLWDFHLRMTLPENRYPPPDRKSAGRLFGIMPIGA
jgi:hypothetical protein